MEMLVTARLKDGEAGAAQEVSLVEHLQEPEMGVEKQVKHKKKKSRRKR